ncbi:putative DnaJ domain, tetratricopeptide-like helical domain superfamily [Helianthus annuus]|nr:putative DnaJ domain, tetratricopeptide-like helical domain superfamily [Helianthus annuus]
MASSPPHGCLQKKHWWWLTNKKIADMYIKQARSLFVSKQDNNIASAINLLDSALAVSPTYEPALKLKATALLHLRRFNEVADMLQDYIPSMNMTSDDASSSSSDNNSQPLVRERVKLLSDSNDSVNGSEEAVKCFSVSDLKKKVVAGFVRNRNREHQWRYLILGQACCHLGLLEDAMALLQTGKRLASAAFRRESICWSDDSFAFTGETFTTSNHPHTTPHSENINNLLNHIKLLLRRKTAAIAAAEAGLHAESIRHFSKIINARRGTPPHFLADCYIRRAIAYRTTGRITESIADCNRTLALNPSCIEALTARAELFESIRCVHDSLHDYEHLKLIYNSILRDRKLPGPVWKQQRVSYNEVPNKLLTISTKIEKLKQRVANAKGETRNDVNDVDYYALFGVRRGCSRSELERSHLLLTIRYKPDKFLSFVERCEFVDAGDVELVKERARVSGLLLYRLIQRGYTSLMRIVLDEEALEKQRMKVKHVEVQQQCVEMVTMRSKNSDKIEKKDVFQGVFCRDLAVVGSLLCQTGFNHPIQVKYEGLSC